MISRSPHMLSLVALAKRKRGEKLTDREEIVLAYLYYAGGCHACRSPKPTDVTDLVRPTEVMN